MKIEQLNKIKCINGDCMEYMKSLPDKYFDLAIVDPPYGIGMDGKIGIDGSGKAKNYKNKSWDSTPPEKEFFDELIRVSKNQIIWGANHFISLIPFDGSCWIVWDKNKVGKVFADCELAWTSFPTAIRKFEYTWHGMLQGNMKNKQIRIHPTEKPIQLYEWLLSNYAKKGDKILDTHGGSFSHAIACHNLGFELTIIEKDKDYYDEATKRLKWHQRQGVLFDSKEMY